MLNLILLITHTSGRVHIIWFRIKKKLCLESYNSFLRLIYSKFILKDVLQYAWILRHYKSCILCPRLGAEWIGRFWDLFLWQVYTPSKSSCLLSFWLTCHKIRSQRRPRQPWDPPNSLRSKPRSLGQSIGLLIGRWSYCEWVKKSRPHFRIT